MHHVKSRSALVVAVCLAGAPNVCAGPQLLYSLPRSGGAGASPAPEGPVEIVLHHWPDLFSPEGPELGGGILWEDGDTGTVDFSSGSPLGFDEFAAGVTNGIDDYLVVLITWPGAGGGGFADLESDLGLGSPDLIGNELDFIRLVVHDVTIYPWGEGLEGFFAEVELTYEFWGEPIPEPATIMLVALGFLGVAARKVRLRW